MRVYLCGQKAFGAAAYEMIRAAGHEIVGVSSPALNGRGTDRDRLSYAAERGRTPWLESGKLNATMMPEGVDLIVAAHSHDFIGRATLGKTRLGGVGYHPSLLPRHKGRDAVRWTIHLGDPIAGGTVYWLSDAVDGGDVAAQDFVFVAPDETVDSLWREKLSPLGLRLLAATLADLSAGVIRRQPQDRRYATWEPSWGRAPLHRPDLIQIGPPPAGMRIEVTAARA